MTDELREKVAQLHYEASRDLFDLMKALHLQFNGPPPEWHDLNRLARKLWTDDADRAIAICREHYEAEIARLTRERDEAYTRGWNDAAKPGSAVLAEKIEGVFRRALRKEEGDA